MSMTSAVTSAVTSSTTVVFPTTTTVVFPSTISSSPTTVVFPIISSIDGGGWNIWFGISIGLRILANINLNWIGQIFKQFKISRRDHTVVHILFICIY